MALLTKLDVAEKGRRWKIYIFVDGIDANGVAVEVREDTVILSLSVTVVLGQVSSCEVQAITNHVPQANMMKDGNNLQRGHRCKSKDDRSRELHFSCDNVRLNLLGLEFCFQRLV